MIVHRQRLEALAGEVDHRRSARHLIDERGCRESPVGQFVNEKGLVAQVVVDGGGEYLGVETHVVCESPKLYRMIRRGVSGDEHRHELVNCADRLRGGGSLELCKGHRCVKLRRHPRRHRA